MAMTVKYFHPVSASDGRRLSAANIIWTERDRGDHYYRKSRFAMERGRFPASHPCAPFDDETRTKLSSQIGSSKSLTAFRDRGYWASCFPEGDGITLKWWQDVPAPTDKSKAEVIRDIEECFGWNVVDAAHQRDGEE